jgi:hypothetical protein
MRDALLARRESLQHRAQQIERGAWPERLPIAIPTTIRFAPPLG